MNFSAESVEKAVYQFYFVPANQVEAHQWLTIAQESPEAWSFCWELMQPSKSQEVQFFGANALCGKLSKFWTEITEEQYAELKLKLIHHIVTYVLQDSKIILTRLCVALSNFIIRTIPSFWPTAIEDVMNIFQPANLPAIPPEKSTSVLLLILTVVMEEFQTVILAQSFRCLVRNHLHSNSDRVIYLIENTLVKSNNVSLSLHAFKCFQRWIVFGISLPAASKVIDSVFQMISENEFCEAASDVLQSIVHHPESHKYPDSVLKLLERVLKLEENLRTAVREKDMETSTTLCSLFTAFGESHMSLFLKAFLTDDTAKENFLSLVKIILACTGAPGQYPTDETFSYITFAFWYSLQDEIISADKVNANIYRNYFVSIFENLVDFLLQKLMSPKIKSPAWTPDEIEQFRCYREDIGDTFMYCYNLLRTRMLERLLSHLTNVLLNAKSNSEELEQALEACLSAFQSVADSVDTDESKYVPQFLSQLLNIPYQDNPNMLGSIIDAVGAYAEWINCNPEVLPEVIPLILLGLNEPRAASSATLALTDISRDCQLNMRPFAESILTVCEQVLAKRTLKEHEEFRLMSSVGYIGSLLTPEVLMNFLKKLLTPTFIELQGLSQKPELSAADQTILISRIKTLSMLFNTLNIKLKDEEDERRQRLGLAPREFDASIIQPALPVLEEFLPILKDLVSRWPLCSSLSDAICELLKRALSNLMDDAQPALGKVLHLLNLIYSSLPSAAALNLYKMAAILFFDYEDQKMSIQQSLILIINTTLRMSQTGNLSNHSDICDAFCQTLANLLKKRPSCLVHDDINLLILFQYGIAVIALPEAPAVKAASSFMVSFITQSREYPNMLNIVNNYGDVLLTQILSCIGGLSPRGVMDSVTDVLLTMIKKYFDNTCRWLHSMIPRDNYPSVHVNAQQKEIFVQKLLKDYSNKRKIQEHVKTFSLSCRGLIGTEYASQILPSL